MRQQFLKFLCAQGMSLGIGLSGVGVASISFLTLWWAHPSMDHAKTSAEIAPESFSYFLLSSLIILAAVVTYFIFFRMPFVRHHRQPEGELHVTQCSRVAQEAILH